MAIIYIYPTENTPLGNYDARVVRVMNPSSGHQGQIRHSDKNQNNLRRKFKIIGEMTSPQAGEAEVYKAVWI